MAFQNVDTLNHGDILQIVFNDGIRNQISEDYRDWENVKRKRVGSNDAREIRFLFQDSYGLPAIQFQNPGQTNRPFPKAKQATSNEFTAVLKEIDATIELEYNLWQRAMRNPTARYLEPLKLEIDSKRMGTERVLSRALYGSGTGVIGTVLSIDETNIATGQVELTFDPNAEGFVGWVGAREQLFAFTPDATINRSAAAGFYTLVASAVNRRDGKVTANIIDVDGNTITTVASTGIAPADVLYRNDQCPVDLTAPVSDYNTISATFAGLESLTANDGRTVHGITMGGVTAGSREDAQGNALDVIFIENALNTAKLAAGEGVYRYNQMCMAPEAHARLVNDRETSRRFITVEDTSRGGQHFAYQHRGDTLKTEVSEFVPLNRIYMLPEDKASKEKVCELHGSDFQTVKAGSGQSDFLLKPHANGSYSNMVTSFMQSTVVLIAKQPNAIAVVENFTIESM